MACEGNGMSDERIGEALIQEVINEELKEMPSEDIPPLNPLPVKIGTEQKKMVTQLGIIFRMAGDRLVKDKELQDAIDGMASCSGSKVDHFKAVANNVFEPGITWERIAVLFYVAGRLAVKMVEALLPQSVNKIFTWTVEFFKNNLLSWILEHGGWINSFSELAVVSMNNMSTQTSNRLGLTLLFVTGMAIGSLVTWRLTRQ